jgi:nucleoside-diphosphate-sugar epimerase
VGIADGIDCLLHLATLGHLSNFSAGEAEFAKVNVDGALNVMRVALAAGVQKIVHCSSVAAMGICRDVPATEKSPCGPHHAYGRSKLRAEKEVLRMVVEQNLPATIVRFSMIYGPGDRRDILKLARMAKRGLLPRVGRRAKLTPLIHVQDAVEGLLLAARKGQTGQIYLITNRQSEPFDRIREIIQTALGAPQIPFYLPEWAALGVAAAIEKGFALLGKSPPVSRKNIESTLADRVFSIEKAHRELGFDPKIDVADGLTKTIAWYREQGWV